MIDKIIYEPQCSISYQCFCGNFCVLIDIFLKFFLQTKELTQQNHLKLFCNIHRSNLINKFCKKCNIPVCFLCYKLHEEHGATKIMNLSYKQYEFCQLKTKLLSIYDNISFEMKSRKENLIKVISEEIEKLNFYKNKIFHEYEQNCNINNQLLSLVQGIMNNYMKSNFKYYHYINLQNVCQINKVYNTKKPLEEINFEYFLDVTGNQKDNKYINHQTIQINIHQKYQGFIHLCKNAFILSKENSQLASLVYSSTQTVSALGYSPFGEQNLTTPEKVIKTEVLDNKTFALYNSNERQICIINSETLNWRCRIKTERDDEYDFPGYSIEKPFMIKLKNSPYCLGFNGEHFSRLLMTVKKRNNLFYPFNDTDGTGKYIGILHDIFEWEVWNAIQLKNNDFVVIYSSRIKIYDLDCKIKYDDKIECGMYYNAFECCHGKLVIVNSSQIKFLKLSNYTVVSKNPFSYNRINTIRPTQNKILYMQRESSEVYLEIYSCCPFQLETKIFLHDGFSKYYNFYYTDNIVLITKDNIVYLMNNHTYEIRPILIERYFSKIDSIEALPNRLLVVVEDYIINYYRF